MPAARHCSRNPFRAWAVMAMIGDVPAVGVFQLADGRRGRQAVHFGHLQVHQHHVERLSRRNASTASRPLLADVDAVPAQLQQAGGDFLIDRRVVGHQDAQRPRRGGPASTAAWPAAGAAPHSAAGTARTVPTA